MSLPSGASFAGYILSRGLGSGVTGEVYLVQDPRSTGRQALKVLSRELSADADFTARFRKETPVVVNLHYRHIVEVHERGQFDGQLYIVMEYIEGTSAAQLMTDRFPAVSPAFEVMAILTAIAGALDYAHLRGLTHRDVKPANILLTDGDGAEQRILLTNFGIAGELGQAAEVTVAYAAPEQLSGDDVDGRADQYALAASAFHLLTGAPPVTDADPVAALRRHRDGKLPRLSDQRPELARLDSVFAKALAERPEDRFETCHDFALAASELAGRSTGEHPEPESPEPERPEPEPDPESDGDDEEDTAAAPEDAAATTPDEPDVPPKRKPRKVLLGAAAVALVAGALVAGIAIGRHTAATPKQVAAPTPTTPAPSPAPLDGSYRIEAQRTKQTYNYVADPQPPDVATWWAFRSSCKPGGCSAAAMQLDDNNHMEGMSPGGGTLFMKFTEGQWQSEPVDLNFPCVGPDGSQSTQRTTLVLALRPQPNGEFVGEQVVTVQTDECGQRSAVIRVPTAASRTGDVPPAVAVPEPGSGPQSPEGHAPGAAPTVTPFGPQN